jgi:hypothetical protein
MSVDASSEAIVEMNSRDTDFEQLNIIFLCGQLMC